MKRTSPRSRAARCKATRKIDDLDLVVDKRTAGLTVLAAPLDVAEIGTAPFP